MKFEGREITKWRKKEFRHFSYWYLADNLSSASGISFDSAKMWYISLSEFFVRAKLSNLQSFVRGFDKRNVKNPQWKGKNTKVSRGTCQRTHLLAAVCLINRYIVLRQLNSLSRIIMPQTLPACVQPWHTWNTRFHRIQRHRQTPKGNLPPVSYSHRNNVRFTIISKLFVAFSLFDKKLVAIFVIRLFACVIQPSNVASVICFWIMWASNRCLLRNFHEIIVLIKKKK